ncbi:MAG: hypothetical protein ACOC12_00490 [Bacteroidota bacterium]
MTGGAGHIVDMIARLRVNESARRRKRFYFTKVKNEYLQVFSDKNIDYYKATPAQLKAIREQIAFNRKNEFKRMVKVIIATTLVSVAAVWLFFFLIKLLWQSI